MTETANPIKRRARGAWFSAIRMDEQPEPAKAYREWVALCPHCGDEVTSKSGYPHYARATRKNTKDALYRHVQEHHMPGSVGR